MSNIKRLEQFISSYKTYNDVASEAKIINKHWRESSWTRALRSNTNIKAIYKSRERVSVIIGYCPIMTLERLVSPEIRANKPRHPELDDKLKEILKIAMRDREYVKVTDILKALKSKNNLTKEAKIKLYDN